MGGLRYHDRKRLCFFVDRGNADSFFEQLAKLNEFVKQEWVDQGNAFELYQQIGPRVVVILDNASYHKRQDILDKVEQELPNIQLCFLPAYSPDFNLIELARIHVSSSLHIGYFNLLSNLNNSCIDGSMIGS